MKKIFEHFIKNREDRITLLASVFSIYALIFVFMFDNTEAQKYTIYILAIVVVLQTWWSFHRLTNKKSFETSDLQSLIEYSKKRKEIDEEIAHLTRSLMKTDVGQFVDLNRLAFSGQLSSIYSDAVNYDKFLERFGIHGGEATVKLGTAAFLSPFNEDGDRLFRSCQNILGKINIFLRRTDNVVNKDDILMNIVHLIVQSEIILVNLNERNMNVYYELGIAHAIGKPTILLAQTEFSNNDLKRVGFDIDHKYIIPYSNEDTLEKELIIQIGLIRGQNDPL